MNVAVYLNDLGETMRRVAGATDDAAEGGRAFREQRAPRWTGH